jgi:hypothetical protein
MFMVDTTRRGHPTAIYSPQHPFELGAFIRKELVFSPYELLRTLALDSWPSKIELHEGLSYDRKRVFGLSSRGHRNLISQIIGASFIRYYESLKGQIQAQDGNTNNWPTAWNFARVIRNAFAHGGMINITNPKSRGVSWGLSYSPISNGRQVLFQDLALGDIIFLMEDMDTVVQTLSIG